MQAEQWGDDAKPRRRAHSQEGRKAAEQLSDRETEQKAIKGPEDFKLAQNPAPR